MIFSWYQAYLIHVCDMNDSFVQHDSFIHECDVDDSFVQRVS